MNAYKIMLFILLFSFSITIVTGLDIYSDAGGVHAKGINFTDDGQVANYDSFSLVWGIIGVELISTVVGGLLAGTVAHFGLGIPADKAFLYSTFVSFYLVESMSAMNIFFEIANTVTYASVRPALLVGVVVFALVVAISLFSFLMQLIGGPWQSME